MNYKNKLFVKDAPFKNKLFVNAASLFVFLLFFFFSSFFSFVWAPATLGGNLIRTGEGWEINGRNGRQMGEMGGNWAE